jgi:hypothetical protein
MREPMFGDNSLVSRTRCNVQRCTADAGPSKAHASPMAVPVLQCITALRCVLHCARDTLKTLETTPWKTA